jgi:hypothetical protein
LGRNLKNKKIKTKSLVHFSMSIKTAKEAENFIIELCHEKPSVIYILKIKNNQGIMDIEMRDIPDSLKQQALNNLLKEVNSPEFSPEIETFRNFKRWKFFIIQINQRKRHRNSQRFKIRRRNNLQIN